MSGVYAFRPILRGDSGALAFYLRRVDILTLERLPLDLTDTAVELTLAAKGVDDVVLTRANGLVVSDADGSIRHPLAPTDTIARPAGVTGFRLRLTDTDGAVTTVLTGTIPFVDWPMNEPIPVSPAIPSGSVSGSDVPFEVVEVVVPYNEGTVAEAVRQAKLVVSQLTVDQINGLRDVLAEDIADGLAAANTTSIINSLVLG